MLTNTNRRRSLKLLTKLWTAPVLLLLLAAGSIRSAIADSDILYVGDVNTNTVKRIFQFRQGILNYQAIPIGRYS